MEKNIRKKSRNYDGITLIALVVTIVVLLILAGVSIGLVFNGDGLFIKANEAASKYNQAKEDEANFLNKILGGYGGEIEPGENKEESILTLSETSGEITYPNPGTFEIIENSSNGDLSVSSSDDSIASASISGNAITITPKSITEIEKEVIITVKSGETEKYKEQTATYVATIKQGGITIVAVPNVREYSGTAFEALSSVTVTPTDAIVEYSLNDGEYQNEIPQITEAGEYTITIKASKTGYVTKEISKTVTVSKQSSVEGNLVLAETSGTIKYPDTKTVNIINNASNGTLSVTSSNENVATASISNNQIIITPQIITTNGQTATLTVKSGATNNYEEQTATYVVTVNKGIISISATAYNEEYDGISHPAVSNVSTNPSGCKITYSINNGRYTTMGDYTTNIPTKLAQDQYTIKIKAEKDGYHVAEKTLTSKIGACSIETAKAIVKRDGLQPHQGIEVIYNPTAGGTWRVFYYDTEGYFGTTNKLYIKRDYENANVIDLTDYENYSPSDGGALMKKMNPKWASSSYSAIDLVNEHCVAWLCDQTRWTNYKVEGVADYAIGSPSLEMFMKAYNVYKDNNPNSTTLINKIASQYGYSVGFQNKYTTTSSMVGWMTDNGSVEQGPYNVFRTSGDMWLSSPGLGNSGRCLRTITNAKVSDKDPSSGEFFHVATCPVVCIK